MSSTYYAYGSHGRVTRQPVSLVEGIRIYFSILFGVAVSLLAFYYLFPQ